MGNPTICIGKNKGADQFRSYCEADQHLCFSYTDSTVIYPVSNLIQFRIKWLYRHELHSSCSIKKQMFCMVIKSIFFSSSARSQILKTYLHAKNKSVLRDDLSN